MMKYIRKRDSGNYEIRKWINDKVVSFGCYPTLEEAQYYRDYFEKKGWDVNERHKFCLKPKYYSCNGNGYQISKQIGGKQIYFDYVKDLEDVKKEVKNYLNAGWDLDALCEGIDERVDGEIIYLNKRM